jgi:hypothetical protein
MTTMNQAILDTVLGHLALFFLAATAGDMTKARQAAAQTIAAYHPQSPEELTLASEIISFSFQALEALGQAAAPDLSLNRTLRLRGSAVSLSRESHKARRKLDQLQRAHRNGIQPEPVEAPPRAPQIEAVSVVEAERPAAQPTAKTQAKFRPLASFNKFDAARQITENLKKKQAEHLIAAASAAQGACTAA